MSKIDKEGMLVHVHVQHRRYTQIEQGALEAARAIVIHQTDASDEQSTFNAYARGGHGAHFLIAKNGTLYQTASLFKRCFHVGARIKSRCLELLKANCRDPEIAKALALGWSAQIAAINEIERRKTYPERFPVNSDSIGIELVGRHIDERRYEAVTAEQNHRLQWLIDEIYRHFSISSADVFRHPQVSYKHPDEAGSAVWR